MKISKEARKLSRELFRQSFVNGRIDESRVRALVSEVLRQKPRGAKAVLGNYVRLLRLELQKRHAIVESATPLDDASRSRVLEDLKARHGSDLTVEFQVAPELIGGLRIRLGSDVWDGSVQNRLARLEQSFTHA